MTSRDLGLPAAPVRQYSDSLLEFLFNILAISNTSSNDALRKTVKQMGNSAHPAMFPRALPDFFIRMLIDEGDRVLDPFAGSNTTGWVADCLQRKWISMDINRDYVEGSKFRWEDHRKS